MSNKKLPTVTKRLLKEYKFKWARAHILTSDILKVAGKGNSKEWEVNIDGHKGSIIEDQLHMFKDDKGNSVASTAKNISTARVRKAGLYVISGARGTIPANRDVSIHYIEGKPYVISGKLVIDIEMTKLSDPPSKKKG